MSAALGWKTTGVAVEESDAEVAPCLERGTAEHKLPPGGGDLPRPRGQPSRASECWFDVRMAIRELEVARDLYVLANDTTDPRTRRERMRAAHDRAGLAARFLAFLLERPAR